MPAPAETDLAWNLAPEWQAWLLASGLWPLRLAGRVLLPIVQGGMGVGVGVSAHRLAGTAASLDGVGTISSVDLRRHHRALMARTQGLSARAGCDADSKAQIDAADLEALDREVRAARQRAAGRWTCPTPSSSSTRDWPAATCAQSASRM